jgi:hypothetical protein
MALLGTAAALSPAAYAQQPVPVIGYLSSGSLESDNDLRLTGFRQGLNAAGYVEGQTSRSNTVGRKANMIYCRPWRPIWFVVR